MQFSNIFVLATAIAGAAAAPAPAEAQTGGIQCYKHDGKWHYGWTGAKPEEKYTCKTGGLIVSVESQFA